MQPVGPVPTGRKTYRDQIPVGSQSDPSRISVGSQSASSLTAIQTLKSDGNLLLTHYVTTTMTHHSSFVGYRKRLDTCPHNETFLRHHTSTRPTMIRIPLVAAFATLALTLATTAMGESPVAPEGFRVLFNGKDLDGWHGRPHFSPIKLAAMDEDARSSKIAEWTADAKKHWTIDNGELVNDGHGAYLVTNEDFRDYELLVEYKTVPIADSGIYLKGNPQVQIWDYTEEKKFEIGANLGSGGLWNNSDGAPGKDPSTLADKPFGQWNKFKIRQVGARTTVWLNGKEVVHHAIMENYWDRKNPLFPEGPIELQTHGGEIRWRNIYVRNIESDEANKMLSESGNDGFTSLFNGEDLDGWQGANDNYEVVDGAIQCRKSKGGQLVTKKQYADFVARLEFKLPPAGNNGLAIRSPGDGDPAYKGMCELQVLDSEHQRYAKLDARQYHGSAYGKVAAKRGYLRETGQWNFQEVTVVGSKILSLIHI